MERLPLMVAALWWGSLSTIGFLVVPFLFAYLPTPAVAGNLAAKLFSAQAWITLACGILLLMLSRLRSRQELRPWPQSVLVWIAVGMLMAVLLEFAIAPRILARDNLRVWHSLGSLMFAAQWVCAGTVLWKLSCTNSRHHLQS